ncbi:MAG: hypothetical protein AAB834_01835 [Patescibacteria group bacterium]
MSHEASVATLFDLKREVARYLPEDFYEEPVPILDSLDTFRYRMSDSSALAGGIYNVLYNATYVQAAAGPNSHSQPPAFELTRRNLNLNSQNPELQRTFSGGCYETELLFARSLAWHGSGRDPNPNHAAAIVLHDIDGAPFAYQKSSGHPTAYVWREGYISTQAGNRWLPAGALVDPVYERIDTIVAQEEHTEQGLVSLVNTDTVLDVNLLRFSATCLPAELRLPFLEEGVAQNKKLSENFVDACALTDGVVGSRVGALLARDDWLIL